MPVLQQQFGHQSSFSHNNHHSAAYENAECLQLSVLNDSDMRYITAHVHRTAPHDESSLTNNMMFCMYCISACRLSQATCRGLLLMGCAVLCNDAHGAVDSWLILEVVSMAVLQNVATSDVVIIILQLGKVQSWLALHDHDAHTYSVGSNEAHTARHDTTFAAGDLLL